MNFEFLKRSCHFLIKDDHRELLQNVLHNSPDLLLHPDNSGQTGLELMRTAENSGRTDIIKILKKHMANFADPLKMALYCGNLQSVELFLKNGAKLSDPEWSMEHIFSKKTVDSRKKILELLLEYGQVDIASLKNYRGENLLHILCKNVQKNDEDAVEIAKILINAGVSVDEIDNSELTPLLHSICQHNIPLILFLINKGADVNRRSEKLGLCPLHEGCFDYIITGNNEILRLLLSKGADVNAKDNIGRTVLHRALITKKEELISLFLKYGADISALDNDRSTPYILLKKNLVYFSNNNSTQCKTIMIKEFAKLTFKNQPVSKMDMESIQSDPEDREIFSKCLNKLHQMSRTKFYGSYSFYSVLEMSKSLRKLANLIKNEEFASKFRTCNLDTFPYFKSDFEEIFKEAVIVRDESHKVYSRLRFIFKDFFPDVVVRKLTDNFTTADLPLEIVNI